MYQNYRFDDRLITFKFPSNWSSFEPEAGDFIRLSSYDASENFMEIHFKPIQSVPENQAVALTLYKAELSKIHPECTIQKARMDVRYAPKNGAFPQTYWLSKSEEGTLTIFTTFFIQNNYLYSVSLQTPYRSQMGKMLSDFSDVVSTFKTSPKQEVEVAKPQGETSEDSEEKTPAAEKQTSIQQSSIELPKLQNP